ncbi:MAG: tRNA-intron lyase [Thermoplasmata archaeon]|nr:MAG: tRNA-intron lyase [Thermoplasmata archaeon]
MIITDTKEANRIHNKGYFGMPLSGGNLQLQLIEAAFLLEQEKLEIFRNRKPQTLEDLIKYSTRIFPAFEIYYIVYRDLRLRGFVVKPNIPSGFNVYERGVNPKKTPSDYKIIPLSERAPFVLDELVASVQATLSLRKKLIVAVVDEEGDLTYYSIDLAQPKTKLKRKRLTRKGTAVFVEDRILVWDPALIDQLHQFEFLGKIVGKTLQLSLMEGSYLLDKGIIELRNVKNNRKIGLNHFMRRAKAIQPDFELCNKAYGKLKEHGLIVKTGFKYGTHFRIYKGDPDIEHSDYLMHVVPQNYCSNWPEISRAVRLAHGVRKDMLFARIYKDDLQALKIARIKL